MRRARAVIGAAFGDEGKGLMTDYFVRQGDPGCTTVVRFNGGAQAGHTVEEPSGRRHVFHHFGSGTLAGARTYLTKHFLVNPVLWHSERSDLARLGATGSRGPQILVDAFARVTTPYDMVANQNEELARGADRHGSCGTGIHATVVRHEAVPLFASDLTAADLADKVRSIRSWYDAQRISASNDHCARSEVPDQFLLDRFLFECREMGRAIAFCQPKYFNYEKEDLVFEGAQGLLLSEDCARFFPHVTHSRTGLSNVVELAQQMGVNQLDVAYVVRSYLTRHGAGPLPGEDPSLQYHDSTNAENAWQGRLRFAPMNVDLISEAVTRDVAAAARLGPVISPVMAVTHCDQAWPPFFVPGFRTALKSYGPTHEHVARVRS